MRPIEGNQYSAWTGLIYVFNIIVGTGALAIPGVFAKSGYLLSSFVLIAFAFVSYITVTYTIEALSISNALVKQTESEEETDSDDQSILLSRDQRMDFDITERIEMGSQSTLYYPRLRPYFYTCLIVYLYGDLSIYITAVSKSLRDVFCTQLNSTNDTVACFEGEDGLDRLGAYRLFTILFIFTIGPLAAFNVSKTKYLQIMTTLARWAAFILMIVLSIKKMVNTQPVHPPVANFHYIPSLFGVSIYSFMCHHSLPSLVTPISSKKTLKTLFLLDYILICSFYLILSLTAAFAFDSAQIQDLYTLTFLTGGNTNIYLKYFLGLFPVFTLSSSFPIIAITLKNNLKSLVLPEKEMTFFTNLFFTLVVLIIPFLISVFCSDIEFLVGFTGAFAGSQIQYVIPCLLVSAGRKKVGHGSAYSSPFKNDGWIVFVLIWTLGCTGITVYHFIRG